jgi:DNA polymerase-3 subunit epsilon/CBS domain-containing protein
MRTVTRHTPLFALDAVAFDTETTGLDPSTARIIEIGAVFVSSGRVLEERRLQSFVAIRERVPAMATAVHGITDQDLSEARPFAAVYEELKDFIGPRVVVGHTLGFDMAVLKKECERAGVAFTAWPTLDVRFLAEIADPTLASFSLEGLAAWLGLPVSDRHRAVGDARIAGDIFLALAPKLRSSGIRTFGEAARACSRLTRVLDHHHRAGWVEPSADLIEADRHEVERRLDSFPYRHRVRDVMTRPPAFIADKDPAREALARLIDGRISSLFVGSPETPASATGIVTERDLLRVIRQRGLAALEAPVGALASRPLITVSQDAFAYRAIGRMRRCNIRHLAAVSQRGYVVGALSARDLLRQRADAAIVLGDDLDAADDVAGLARAWAKVPAVAASLVEEGVSARDVAGVIASELRALARRAGELAEVRMARKGKGGPPCAYALLVLGSAGRGESLLALDQDHALVFEHGDPDGPEDRWFAEFGSDVSDTLHEVGLPYCPGGVMASKAPFRGSLQTWRQRISQWVGRARPEDLLNVDIFYDMRPVHGDAGLASTLWEGAWKAARSASPFLKLLAEANAIDDTPFGLFRRLAVHEGRIDLKRHGLRPIVANARLLALRHGVAAHATAERLEGVKALGVGGSSDLTAADAIHERILELILRAQLADLATGTPASNRVPLAVIEQQRGGTGALKKDLRLVASLDDLVRDQLS